MENRSRVEFKSKINNGSVIDRTEKEDQVKVPRNLAMHKKRRQELAKRNTMLAQIEERHKAGNKFSKKCVHCSK